MASALFSCLVFVEWKKGGDRYGLRPFVCALLFGEGYAGGLATTQTLSFAVTSGASFTSMV